MKRMLLGAIILAVSSILLGPVLNAGSCRSRVFYPTYSAPVVQSYVTPYVNKNVVLVPKAVQVQVSPDYYYSVADHYRDKLLVDAIAGRLQQMQAAGQLQAPQSDQNYQELMKMFLQLQLQQRASPYAPTMPPAQGALPGGIPQIQAGSVNPALVQVIETKCIRCHNPGTKQGGLDLTNLVVLDECAWWKAYGLVNSGEMPKGGQPLTDEQTLVFYQQARNFKK